MILTTIIAIWLAWWSHKARQQREAVAALRKAGASVQYDCQMQPLLLSNPRRMPDYWPEWLVDFVGIDYFASVVYVSFHQETVLFPNAISARVNLTDHEFGLLKALPALEYLDLSHPKVTDAHLEHLKTLNRLQWINLSRTQVSDRGLEHLHGLTALEDLDLSDTQVTAASMTRLQKALPKCEISTVRVSQEP